MAASLFVLATLYRTVFTVAGGYLTARLAPGRPMRHAVVLGAIGIVAATAGTLATWDKGPEFGPKWYPISLIVLALPSVLCRRVAPGAGDARDLEGRARLMDLMSRPAR